MNSVFLVVIAAMILIVVLLRFKVLIGPAILSGGLLIWLFESRSFEKLWVAFTETLTMQRTWDLLLCLYFVMCLEVELRKSGSLHGMVVTLRNIFSSNKVTLAFMPAFWVFFLPWEELDFPLRSYRKLVKELPLTMNKRVRSTFGSAIFSSFQTP